MFAKNFRRYAWEALRGNWAIMILITVIYSALIAISSSVLGVGPLILTGPLTVGLYGVTLSLLRRKQAPLEGLFDGFTSGFADNFLAHLLVSVFTFLWTLLFIIPGIVKAISYSMTFYILRDHPGMSAMDAIEASKRMMHGRKWNFFCLQLSFIGWYLLCLLTGGLLSLLVAPYNYTATAVFYESIKGGILSDEEE